MPKLAISDYILLILCHLAIWTSASVIERRIEAVSSASAVDPAANPPQVRVYKCYKTPSGGRRPPLLHSAECQAAISTIRRSPSVDVPTIFNQYQYRDAEGHLQYSVWRSEGCYIVARSRKSDAVGVFSLSDVADQAAFVVEKCVRRTNTPLGGWLNMGPISDDFYVSVSKNLPHFAGLADASNVSDSTSTNEIELQKRESPSIEEQAPQPVVRRVEPRFSLIFNASDLGLPSVDCFQPHGGISPTSADDCSYVIDNVLLMSGPQMKPIRWAYDSTSHFPLPMRWVYHRCIISVANRHTDAKDLFNLVEVANTARRINQRCVLDKPANPIGGSSSVGNHKGFFVAVQAPAPYFDSGLDAQPGIVSVASGVASSRSTDAPNIEQLPGSITSRDASADQAPADTAFDVLDIRPSEIETRDGAGNSPPAEPRTSCIYDFGSPSVDPSDCMAALGEAFFSDSGEYTNGDGNVKPVNLSNINPAQYSTYYTVRPAKSSVGTCYVNINATNISSRIVAFPAVSLATILNGSKAILNDCGTSSQQQNYHGGAVVISTEAGGVEHVYLAFAAAAANQSTAQTKASPANPGLLNAAVAELFVSNGTTAVVAVAQSVTPVVSQASSTATATATRGAGAQFGFWGP